jgi:hypothetical protein
MKCNLGSEVLLRAKTLGKDNFATTDSLQALAYAWFAKRYQPIAPRHIQTWGLQRTDRAVTTSCLLLNHGIRVKRR